MAWETGTANGHVDLMNKLVTFLSDNADLKAANQNWQVLRNAAFPFSMPWPGRIAFNSSTSYSTTGPDRPPPLLPSRNVKWRATGILVAAKAGVHEFALRTTDSVLLRIDGAIAGGVYTANFNANTFASTFSINLTAGNHAFELLYINGDNSASGLSIAWKQPGDSAFSIVPASQYVGMTTVYGVADYSGTTQAAALAVEQDKEYSLKAPGLSQGDSIYVNTRTTSNTIDDAFNVVTRYAVGFDSAYSAETQPGTSDGVRSFMWNQSIKYWFVGSGRRFIVIAKISTTYAVIYGGFILPYGLPSEIPYPVAVGGNSQPGDARTRWSIQNEYNGAFWNPSSYSSITTSSLLLRRTDGNQEAFANFASSTSAPGSTYPYAYTTSTSSSATSLLDYRASPSGDYAIQPIVLNSPNGPNVWGELDGVFHISGHNNASENIITVAGQDYLVVQGGFRTTPHDYAAIRLR